MKAFCGILSMLLPIVQLMAQPTLSSTDVLPTVGERFGFQVFEASTLPAPATGSGITWDYSGIVPTSTSNIFVNSPINKPNGTDYPGANLVLEQDSLFLYYEGNSSTFSLHGLEAGTNQAIYTDPDEQLTFPLTYLSSGMDSFAGTFDVSIPNIGQFLSYRSGSSSFVADGYGTLILPSGTFNDVLKVTLNSVQEDSIRLINFDTIINTTITSHQWFQAGTHTPILTITETITDLQPLPVFAGTYYDVIVGLEGLKVQEMNFSLTYSPDFNTAKLKYELERSEVVQIAVYDVSGREVVILENSHQSRGPKELRIDLTTMNPGLYFVRTSVGESVRSEKLIVR